MASLFEMIRAVAPTELDRPRDGRERHRQGAGRRARSTASPAAPTRPFVSINCGALPDTLLESELFGHVKGAFTDARQSKKGLFEAASGGTLFLDEVGETSPADAGEAAPRAAGAARSGRVGGTDEVEVDVRVIAATNVPLEDLVQQRASARTSSTACR